jgi:cyclopropane fatty-acyl-phospholipid synthase-like methyltransferase
LPVFDGPVDMVLMLDMLHLISDVELKLALERIYQRLSADGTLIIHATVPSDKKMPWKRRIESIHLKLSTTPKRFRREVEIINYIKTGFAVSVYASAQDPTEEKWFVGKSKQGNITSSALEI